MTDLGIIKKPRLTFALNSLGRMVSILDVKSGLQCDCHCPKCHMPLIAKKGEDRQYHFAHQNSEECHGAYMSALHKLAEQIIEDEKAVMVPSYDMIPSERLSFVNVEVEQRNDRSDMQPDLVGITENGERWLIEIRNTSEVKYSKKLKIKESGITCLEIDVRKQELENLRNFLLNSSADREWINNPNYEHIILAKQSNKIKIIHKIFLELPHINLPNYDGYGNRTILIKSSSLVKVSNDGLCIAIDIIDNDDNKYLFVVGYSNSIKKFKSSIQIDKNCNVLYVYVDNIPMDANCINVGNIVWAYNYNYEKENRRKLEEFRNNPEYEILTLKNCKEECNFDSFKGKCAYRNCSIKVDGILYVVCKTHKKTGYTTYLDKDNKVTYDLKEQKSKNSCPKIIISKTKQINIWDISKLKYTKEEKTLLTEYCKKIYVGKYYTNNFGDSIQIIKCGFAQKYFAYIVLYKNYTKDKYFVYGIVVEDGQLVFKEIENIPNLRFAEKHYYDYTKTRNTIFEDYYWENPNPFENDCLGLFKENSNDVPF